MFSILWYLFIIYNRQIRFPQHQLNDIYFYFILNLKLMEHHNYCTQENGVKICNVSSVLPNCSAENILLSERKV